jgi:hypothetical protein
VKYLFLTKSEGEIPLDHFGWQVNWHGARKEKQQKNIGLIAEPESVKVNHF